MRGWFFIIISILLIPFVFAADNLLQDDYNKILAELEEGRITSDSISIISHYGSEGISSENQEAFIGAISELREGKEKIFWESFWKLSPDDRASFINSFKTESKNELLNIFSNQYIKHTKRKDPILEFNLRGDVDVQGGRRYLLLRYQFGKQGDLPGVRPGSERTDQDQLPRRHRPEDHLGGCREHRIAGYIPVFP